MADIIQIDLNKTLAGTPYKDKRIVGVALSGGRDSVALCHALKTAGENIVAINVEHGIRGESSLKDSEFVRNFCEEQNIKLFSYSVDAPSFAKENGYTLEQAARILRYQIFDRAISCGICDVVALAHHAGDQAETILMHILRGTGIKGLVGMKEVSGRYIRPLLTYSRDDINAYISANDLAYVEDETNKDLSYSRNFLREELSRLNSRYPELEKSFARLSRLALETDEFVEAVLPEIYVDSDEVSIKTSDCANSFVFKRLVMQAAKALGVCQDIEEKHLNALVELAKNGAGKMLNLSHGIVAYKDADRIVLTRTEQAENAQEQLVLPFEVRDFECFKMSVKEVDDIDVVEMKKGEALFADLDKLPIGCVVRTRREGDFIEKFGGGTKSLGDFLTDKKIPLRLRDKLPIVAKGKEVFVIVGVEVSAKVKVDDKTMSVIKFLKLQ